MTSEHHDVETCGGCTGDYQCHACGHCRDLVVYGPHYLCPECAQAIDWWRRTELEMALAGWSGRSLS
jgi:hypothetical protein